MNCPTGPNWPDQMICYLRIISNPASDPYMVLIQVVVPIIAVFAATGLALASWRTANRATAIADAALRAERDRDSRQSAQDTELREANYQIRLDKRIVALIDALGSYSAAMRAWAIEATDVQIGWGGDPDDAPFPLLPSSLAVYTKLQGAMLFARGDDRLPMAQIDGYIRDFLKSRYHYKTESRVRYLIEQMRAWRDGSVTRKTFMARMTRKRDTIKHERDSPPPIERGP